MADMPTEILLFELNRVTNKMRYVTDTKMIDMLRSYARDLRNELLYRGALCSL